MPVAAGNERFARPHLRGAGSVAGVGVPLAGGVDGSGVTMGADVFAGVVADDVGAGCGAGAPCGAEGCLSGPFWPHAPSAKAPPQARQKLTTIEEMCRKEGIELGMENARKAWNEQSKGW
jgi:hypothetical protein